MAVLALKDLDQVWNLSKSATSYRFLVLEASLLIYDSLNDDDEEIREAAAEVASRALRLPEQAYPPKPVLPMVASHQLARSLGKTFSDSKSLCNEAISRIRGSALETEERGVSTLQTFAKAREENTSLFITEKQNLYLEDVREALLWSAVARGLQSAAVTKKTFEYLRSWVHESLRLLLDTTRSEHDDALGWSSKPEVFVFAMRALCGASVLLHWSAVMDPSHYNGSTILKILGQLVETGRQNGLHGILLDRAEKVLQRSIIWRIRAVGRHVVKLQKRIKA
jgi:hypothetical protein